METKNIGLISHDEFYQDESSYEDESVEDDDAITQSGFVEAFDKTDQEISTHELKNDDSESSQCDDDDSEEEGS
jgi:hypothetical protein